MTANELFDSLDEDLRKWFREKWVRFGPDGKIRGSCARGSDSEGKPKCLPQAKAHALGKKGRAKAASRKRRQDPNPERRGKAINVKTRESVEQKNYDHILVKLCHMIIEAQEASPEQFGMVAACVVGPSGQEVCRINYEAEDGRRVHAERAAIDAYENEHGSVNNTCTIITTLSPCNRPMQDRVGEDCEQLIKDKGITQVYCGYEDPSQTDSPYSVTSNEKIQQLCKRFADTFLPKQSLSESVVDQFVKRFTPWVAKQLKLDNLPKIQLVDQLPTDSFGTYDADNDTLYVVTKDRHPVDVLRTMAHELVHYKQDQLNQLGNDSGATGSDQENQANAQAGVVMRNFNQEHPDFLKHDLDENFHDGRNPGRKGLAKRMGVNCKQSVTKLRKIAKNSTGERQRMAHWCANMKSGKRK